MTDLKFIVVTGGVYSGLGKGIVAASIASLLQQKYKVANIKWDGYHNNNPGTMNPIEHGEVFVLDDGTEADLDFGHYERFTGVPATGEQSITRGKLNDLISQLEKEGKRYKGRTIEEIPHLRDLLLEQITLVAQHRDAEVLVIEVGGNVGDDSASLALHAARMIQHRFGRHNVMYVHVAPMCYTIDDHEPKSRPIQRSLSELTAYGIEVDMLVVRTAAGQDMKAEQRRKISEASILSPDAIIEARSLVSVYALPIEFLNQGVDKVISRALGITVPQINQDWVQRVHSIMHPTDTVRIALCGKYTNVNDSYKSVKEALLHAGATKGIAVDLVLISTEHISCNEMQSFDAVIVPGGYGSRGVEGKIVAIHSAREDNIPFLGLCYGMQLAVVEFARNVCGLQGAHTTEIDKQAKYPVIDILPEQHTVTQRSGTQRLGAQFTVLEKDSAVANLYKKTIVAERHRHRYEVNPEFHKILGQHGMRFSGVHAERSEIVEFIELPQHPFFIATQSHPELKSTFLSPAPLFQGLVDAAIARKRTKAVASGVTIQVVA